MTDFECLWAMQPEAFAAFLHATAASPGSAAASPQALAPSIPSGAGLWGQNPAQKPSDEPPYTLHEGVAVIPVEGVIQRQSLHTLAQSLQAALDAHDVTAILLSVHSPGGQARGVKEVADAIFAARRTKPCAAFVDGMAASAAYWLASATGSVYAGPSAEVGSIGVILRHMDKSGWNKAMGLSFTYVTAGSRKALGHPDAALSERDRALLQARVDAIYDMFCGDVAQYMNLDPNQRGAWADGRDFLAAEAESLGLVTAIVPSRAEAIKQLLKESHMDKVELAQRHPELLAEIQREATEAALHEAEDHAAKAASQAAAEAQATALALMETVCGKATADKVRALMATNIRPEQLAAAAQALGNAASPATPDPRADILSALTQATPAAVSGESGASPDDSAALISRIGGM